MFNVITEHPIAVQSPDHLSPWGTANDNSTDINFILQVEEFFKAKNGLNILDLGCSGGQLTVDFASRGHNAIGLEGSDYSIKHSRANWPKYHNTNLFLCDVSKPFQITFNNQNCKFDVITAWEFLEHPTPEELVTVFDNVSKHLHPWGIFVASITHNRSDIINGLQLHQTRMPISDWKSLLNKWFYDVTPCPFTSWVRTEGELKIVMRKHS